MYNGRTFRDVVNDYSEFILVKPEGYGVDRHHANLVYVQENAFASLFDRTIRWKTENGEQCIPLEQGKVYMAPSGYKVQMEKHPCAPSWRLIGTNGEGTVCTNPARLAEVAKRNQQIASRLYAGWPHLRGDIDKDFDDLQNLFDRDYSNRWRENSAEKPNYAVRPSRKVLDPSRSLGSVIKLLTPSREYTDDYNKWLQGIPTHLYAMAFIIKRFCKPEWNGNWRQHFGVDVVNGDNGHELKFENRKLVGMYLRVGLDPLGRWRMYKLRQDFAAAAKNSIGR